MRHHLCAHCRRPIERHEQLVVAEDAHGDDQELHAKCYAEASDPAYWEWVKDEKADRRRNERLGL